MQIQNTLQQLQHTIIHEINTLCGTTEILVLASLLGPPVNAENLQQVTKCEFFFRLAIFANPPYCRWACQR